MSVLSMFSLEGKVAIVTGGAGLYGRQIATALAEAGAQTIITSRNEAGLSELEAGFMARGVAVSAHQLDQADEQSIIALRDRVMADYGRVDVLVNNAVLRIMSGWQDPLEKFEQSMQANASGLFAMTRAFGDIMAEQGSGSIINIGSIQGMIGPDRTLYDGMPFHGFVPDYFFHKGGMVNFTRFTASYYGSRNVRCNCISPGGFSSDQTPPAFDERYSTRTVLGRMANESDLMGGIVFLASDASQYVTGINMPIDGGYTAI